MPSVQEFRLFEVCLSSEKKNIMIRALDNYLDMLERIQASKIKKESAKLLKDEIDKMKECP